ncbi:HNH endonuclease [Agromyces ramosus]|uniref:HNH endonuclease n=1 Tax=Agromyces ramosus TaxID=33879 RepID=A0ABU0R8Q0_9MICO|nr:HNH endonuclease [Agromyces ramosus]MDQ0894451.1 hypothetical protein [Agromyces ramosus]
MIGPKLTPPTKAEERDAYDLATVRDLDSCQRCRRDCGPTARDHRRNRSQGGWTVPSNLQVLGLGCHAWKSEHPLSAVEDGWGVPGWGDWREWPARRWVLSRLSYLELVWVIYDDAGKWAGISENDARERMTSMGWTE